MVAPLLPEIVERKRAARVAALARRAGCDPALGVALARHVLVAMAPPAGAVVAGFWPMDRKSTSGPCCGHYMRAATHSSSPKRHGVATR